MTKKNGVGVYELSWGLLMIYAFGCNLPIKQWMNVLEVSSLLLLTDKKSIFIQ